MSSESDFIASLRPLASDAAARGLLDDAAVLEIGGERLVVTHDMIVEGVHFLASDPPGDVAWKLLAVNLSDLAAKGAAPMGVLLGYELGGDADWDAGFVAGLSAALAAFGLPLLGGDTVSPPRGTPRAFGMTAFGRAGAAVPSRAGAAGGDLLWVSGALGDAGAGLQVARGELRGPGELVERYRQPRPRIEAGQHLAPLVSAMMDVSDGLLIDAARLAGASGLAARIRIDCLPLSAAFISAMGEDRGSRLFAATAGDDYELLFTAPRDCAAGILALSEDLGLPLNRIGRMEEGAGLRLFEGEEPIPAPEHLGFEHER